MTLDEAIQSHIDDIMDSFDFARCVKGLRVAEECWINEVDIECREYELRRAARKRLKEAARQAIMREPYAHMKYGSSNTGCLIGTCTICTEPGNQWVNCNLTCYIENTINDGINYE